MGETAAVRAPPCRCVKHIRLFGFRVEPETASIRWLLHYAGRYDDVEHIDVNVITSEAHTEEYKARNPYKMIPFLEVVLDGANPDMYPPGCKKVSELTPWKLGAPACTVETAAGETIAHPDDRVFALTEAGAIAAFLCEHFGISDLWNPRSVFQRCRSFEFISQKDILSRRVASMIMILILTKSRGTSEEEIINAIAAHERELLWSFRQFEDIFTARERRAASDAGLDYPQLIAQGEAEVAALERNHLDAQVKKTADQNDAASSAKCQEAKLGFEGEATTGEKLPSAAAGNTSEEFSDGTLNGSGGSSEKEMNPLDPGSDGDGTKQSPKKETKVEFRSASASDEEGPTRGFTSPALVALKAYIGGEALSFVDLFVTCDLQLLPFLQTWLPGSLRQRNFPATLRYLDRMRRVKGFDKTVKPSRSFLKLFRRRPNVIAESPILGLHTARVIQALEAKSAAEAAKTIDGDGESNAVKNEGAVPSEGEAGATVHRSDPRLRPQQHGRVLHFRPNPNDGDDDGADGHDSRGSASGNGQDKDDGSSVVTNASDNQTKRRGRSAIPVDWAPRVCAVPMCSPCTLSHEDEEALRRSKRPKTRRTAKSADSRRVVAENTPESAAVAPISSNDRKMPESQKMGVQVSATQDPKPSKLSSALSSKLNSNRAAAKPAPASAARSPAEAAVLGAQIMTHATAASKSKVKSAQPQLEHDTAPGLMARSRTAQPSIIRSTHDVVSVVVQPPGRVWRHDPYSTAPGPPPPEFPIRRYALPAAAAAASSPGPFGLVTPAIVPVGADLS